MDKENDFSFQPGTELAAQHTKKLIADLRETYRILRLFGAVQLTFAVLALFSFSYQFEMYDAFENQAAKYITMSVTAIFLYVFFRLAWFLFSYSDQLEKRIHAGRFCWRIGSVTGKYRSGQPYHSIHRSGRHYDKYIFVDGEKCMALGWENYRNANVGDAYLVVYIEQGKGGLQYAMKA